MVPGDAQHQERVEEKKQEVVGTVHGGSRLTKAVKKQAKNEQASML